MKASLRVLGSPGRRAFLQTAAGGMLFALFPSPTAAYRWRPSPKPPEHVPRCQTGCGSLNPSRFGLDNSRLYSYRAVRFGAGELLSSFDILMFKGKTRPERWFLEASELHKSVFKLLYSDLYDFPVRSKEDMTLTPDNVLRRYKKQTLLGFETISAASMRRYYIYSNVLAEFMRAVNNLSAGRLRDKLLDDTSLLILSENGFLYRVMKEAIRIPDLYDGLGLDLWGDVRSMLERIIQEALEKTREQMLRFTLCNMQNILFELLQNVYRIIEDVSIVRPIPPGLSWRDSRIIGILRASGRQFEPEAHCFPSLVMDLFTCPDRPTLDSRVQAGVGSGQTLVIQPRPEGVECSDQEDSPCLFEDGSVQMTDPPPTDGGAYRLALCLTID